MDWKFTETGDLEIGPDGDIAMVWGDEQVIQQALFRMKTTKGDFSLDPTVGCSLEEFIGAPNSTLTHAAIETRIKEELSRDFLIPLPDVHVVDLPSNMGSPNEVYILVEFPSVEQESRMIQINASLDLRKGLVYSKANYRDI